MQNNTLYNINQNKVLQDKINSQITTQKKITRPSDDPVIAIRALRLRSNLNEVTQYYEKNIPDARNWMDLTETCVTTTVDIISNMIDQMRTGAKGTLTPQDRNTILESLKQLSGEVYYTGNSDYAGRTIFTGYRTDEKLTFQASEEKTFNLTEQINNQSIDQITYVDTAKLGLTNETNYAGGAVEQDVAKFDIYRIRLAYADIEEDGLTIQKTIGYNEDGSPIQVPATSATIKTVHLGGAEDPYRMAGDETYPGYDENSIIFIPETGELLLGKTAYDDMKAESPETEITVNYDKSKWNKGDLQPQHYFSCSTEVEKPDGTMETIEYNSEYLTKDGRANKQIIQYDVGFNMSLDVNITADELYEHGVTRCVDEITDLLSQTIQMDEVVEKLKGMLKDSSYDHDAVQSKLDAAMKAQTFLSDTLQKKFEHGITEMQKYLDDANLALTKVGNRGLRLDLVENRLLNQKTAFTELQSSNEDADIAELAVQLSSAQLTYNASLAATGKLLQTTLLNYI